jgi:penicillin-binding protein 2
VVTPLQIAYTIGGIVTGGSFHQPHLLASTTPAPEVDFPLSEHTVDVITQAMWGVVNEDGTAAASRIPGIEFSGKTGTAQVIGAENKSRAGKNVQTKNNAWFVGFAPRRNAEIVVCVLVQGGGFGAVSSAPIAKDIVKAYYDKKNGKRTDPLTTSAPSAPPIASVVMAHTAQAAMSDAVVGQIPAPSVH